MFMKFFPPTFFIRKVRTYPYKELKNKAKKPVYGKIKKRIQIINYGINRAVHCNNFIGIKIFCKFFGILNLLKSK